MSRCLALVAAVCVAALLGAPSVAPAQAPAKDIKAFQALMKPAYEYVEGQVGTEFVMRPRAAVQAAAPN